MPRILQKVFKSINKLPHSIEQVNKTLYLKAHETSFHKELCVQSLDLFVSRVSVSSIAWTVLLYQLRLEVIAVWPGKVPDLDESY